MKTYIKDIPIFFIVTRARSGSTLTQIILDAHPHVSAPLESRLIIHLYKKYQKITKWNDVVIDQFIKDVFTERSYRLFWGSNPDELKRLFNKFYITSFADACKVVYISNHSIFEKKEIKIIVDKNPFYARYIPELKTIFSDAKFIHLIRDPRAVVNSSKIAFKSKTARVIFSWIKLNNYIEKEKENNIFLTVKYEDLVKNPQTTFKLIFDFFKLDFAPEILNAHSTINKFIDQHNYLSIEHHRNLSNSINLKSIDSWKEKLSEKEVKFINYMTSYIAKKYGYDYPKPKLNEVELKQFNHEMNSWLFHFNSVVLFYKLPFNIRKIILQLISLFFDKRYEK